MAFFSSLFGQKQHSAESIQTPVDLVTYAAELVSNPDDINPVLDKVRSITAHLKPNEPPSPEESKQLFKVYGQIETYLTTKEPLRTFTKEELRKRIPGPILLQLTNYESSQK